jgi:hypothetical protein
LAPPCERCTANKRNQPAIFPRAAGAIYLFLLDRCRTYDSATRSLSGVIIHPSNGDSGYTANSIAFSNKIIQAAKWKSICLRYILARGGSVVNLKRNAIPFSNPTRAAWVRSAGKGGSKRSGSGTERNDRWDNEAGGITRQTSPLHARVKSAGGPCCRTGCNARTGHTRWERPTHKIAYRNSGNATAAAG